MSKKKIPAGWVTSRKRAYKAHRIAQYEKMNNKQPTIQELEILRQRQVIKDKHNVL